METSSETTELVDKVRVLKAIANENRLLILQWLLDPTDYFEPQVDGDLVEDGVCIGRIVDRIGLSQPTVTSHLKVLVDANLVSSKKIKNWVFYKPRKSKIYNELSQLISVLQLEE